MYAHFKFCYALHTCVLMMKHCSLFSWQWTVGHSWQLAVASGTLLAVGSGQWDTLGSWHWDSFGSNYCNIILNMCHCHYMYMQQDREFIIFFGEVLTTRSYYLFTFDLTTLNHKLLNGLFVNFIA